MPQRAENHPSGRRGPGTKGRGTEGSSSCGGTQFPYMMALESRRGCVKGEAQVLCLSSVDRQTSRWVDRHTEEPGMADTLSAQSQVPCPTGSSDRVLPLGDRCGPPGNPSDITKGALNTQVPAHYHAYLSRLGLGLLSSKWCFRLLLLQDKHSAPAELP